VEPSSGADRKETIRDSAAKVPLANAVADAVRQGRHASTEEKNRRSESANWPWRSLIYFI